MLFLLSGGTVAWTVALEPGGGESRVLLLGFAALVSTSGVLCFLLERDWSHGLSRSAKVPLYALLGVSLSFSTHFTALDLYGKLREVMGCDNSGGALPTIVRTRWQARLLALVAVVTLHGQSAPALGSAPARCLLRTCPVALVRSTLPGSGRPIGRPARHL